MKKIPLTQGKFALVDNSDYEELSKYKWHAHKNRNSNVFYAERNIKKGKGQTPLQMHRSLMGLPKGKEVDHIDMDGLNNQRKNLRICTRSENMFNRPKYKSNTSGFKGVHFNKEHQKWRVFIAVNKKQIHVGYFINKEEAYKAHCFACVKYHGDFSRVN